MCRFLLSLFYLKVLISARTKGGIGDPLIIERGKPEWVSWRIYDYHEDCNKSLPNLYAIMTLISDVPANNANHCLTLHKIRAILAFIVIRTSYRPFRSQPLHPVSNEHLTSSQPRLY